MFQGKLPFTSDWSLNKQLPSHYICSVVSYQTKTKKLLFPTFCHLSPSFLFYIKITFLPSQKQKNETKQKNQPTSQKYHYTVFYLSFLMFLFLGQELGGSSRKNHNFQERGQSYARTNGWKLKDGGSNFFTSWKKWDRLKNQSKMVVP